MIAYCKTDAQAAFTGLADILEKAAATEISDWQPDQHKDNAVLLAEIERIVEASPNANRIRTAFEKAWDVAARAGDAETERELHTRHIDLIADFNAVVSPDSQDDARETYQRHLRSHAAWIRAVSASIDDSGNRPDMKAADGDEIARKVAVAVGDKLKDIATDTHGARVAPEAADTTKVRTDKGGKHVTHTKRISEWGKTAKAVAADFDKSRFIPERGARQMGGCTETQIKQWDLKYPDAEHPHPRWGYYADLRLRTDLKSEYGEVLQNWARYWADYKIAFKEWRKAHPASRRESFRFTPMKKANGYNPEWIGRDENGTIYNAPTK